MSTFLAFFSPFSFNLGFISELLLIHIKHHTYINFVAKTNQTNVFVLETCAYPLGNLVLFRSR